jgi:hypothetical protein
MDKFRAYGGKAYFNDATVGAVCCRVESVPDQPYKALYMMTLGVLAPYRRNGLGTFTVLSERD